MDRKHELLNVMYHPRGMWLIRYRVMALCGCYWIPRVLQHKGEEPSNEIIEQLINEDKIKR